MSLFKHAFLPVFGFHLLVFLLQHLVSLATDLLLVKFVGLLLLEFSLFLQLYVLFEDVVVVHSEIRERVLFSDVCLALGFGVSDPGGR